MKNDNHHAAQAGVSSEMHFRMQVESCGLSLLKTQGDFKKYYGNLDVYNEIQKQLEIPIKMKDEIAISSLIPNCFGETLSAPVFDHSNKKSRKYAIDGYIPQLNMIVEVKYSEKHGTTEEKVHYDFYKVTNEVYNLKVRNKECNFLYAFIGPACESPHNIPYRSFYYEFAKHPLFNKRYFCGFDSTPTLEKVKKFISSFPKQ